MSNVYIIIDIVIVLALAFFAWRGAKKGLILSVLSLVGLVVAFFGARFVSTHFYEPVADIIQPGIYQNIEELEGKALEDVNIDQSITSSKDSLLEILRENEIFPGLVEMIEDLDLEDGPESATESLSHTLADMIAKVALFALAFIVILLLWFLITRLLDLAFKLPILATINTVGGLVLGLAKAVLMVIVLVWVGQMVGWLPAEPTTPILSLFTLSNVENLLSRILM